MDKLDTLNDIMPSKIEEEGMSLIDCANPECKSRSPQHQFFYNCEGEFELEGIIKCSKCGDTRSFSSSGKYIRELGIGLNYAQSKRLSSVVPIERKDDIEEAERSNYYNCHKAAAVMCRRAIQLALIDKGIIDRDFTSMIKDAHAGNEPLLNDENYTVVNLVKLFGDKGAHKSEDIKSADVNYAIYVTVEVLNNLFVSKN